MRHRRPDADGRDQCGLAITAGPLGGIITGVNAHPLSARLAVCSYFDPANMVLYDKGDPIEALRTLGPWIGQVHIKDGIRTKVTGEWGEEVVVGTGDVDWKAFFTTLDEVGFTGDLCIEREAGTTRVADIAAARVMVEGIEA
jgi:sugar phosphate isomerase/epimerase